MGRILNKAQIKAIIAKQRKAKRHLIQASIDRLKERIELLNTINMEEGTCGTAKCRNNILIKFYSEQIDNYKNR